MKKITTLLLIFGFLSLQAQSDKDYKRMAETTCECLDGKELTKKNIESVMGVCIFEAMSDNPKLMEKLDLQNTKSMEKLGERVGLEMVTICPEVFVLLVGEELDNNSSTNTEVKKESSSSNSVEGKIVGFEGKEVFFVLLEDENGRTKKFLWLSSFENDTELLDKGKNAIGKNVMINYSEIEIYNPSLEEYIKRKEITGIYF